MESLIAAALVFVGGHIVLSHPFRAPLVRVLGDKGFMGLYSAVALGAMVWMVMAFRAVGPGQAPLWDGTGALPWALASGLMVLASVLFLGSLHGNPAAPGADPAAAQVRHVFAVTRHPMMWGFALWAACHALVAATPRVLVLTGAIGVLALVGAALQDAKKRAALGPAWAQWTARTSYAPRLGGFARVPLVLWVVAVLFWLGATYGHIHAAHVLAGVWRWL